MLKPQFKPNLSDHNAKYLTFQPRTHSRQYNKSKSTKKSHILMNKNILNPCEPLGDKLLKAALQKNQRKTASQQSNNNRREKTEQSVLQTSMTLESSRCFNHPDKKGEYFIDLHPNKKFCLKCNLTLSNGNNSTFITKEKSQKKHTLDQFKQQLSTLRTQITTTHTTLLSSLQLSQTTYSQHSSYINQSFLTLTQHLQEKRRQLLNNLIIAQQSVKSTFQTNLKRLKKMARSIERYEMDIERFYGEIIEELPKGEFDSIMGEYEKKVEANFRSKLKNMLKDDGVVVYVPAVEMKTILDKARVEYYVPFSHQKDDLQADVQNLSFYERHTHTNHEQRRTGSNSLDSKINDFVPTSDYLEIKPNDNIKLPQKRTEVDLALFQKKTSSFASPRKGEYHKLIDDKENINLQNFQQDYCYNGNNGKIKSNRINGEDCNTDGNQWGRFTFKS